MLDDTNTIKRLITTYLDDLNDNFDIEIQMFKSMCVLLFRIWPSQLKVKGFHCFFSLKFIILNYKLCFLKFILHSEFSLTYQWLLLQVRESLVNYHYSLITILDQLWAKLNHLSILSTDHEFASKMCFLEVIHNFNCKNRRFSVPPDVL